jgi:hypothetical protein
MNNLSNKRVYENDWGYFVDIEKYKYDINATPMCLITNPIFNNGNNNCNKPITNLIICVVPTTIFTVAFACFVYCAL